MIPATQKQLELKRYIAARIAEDGVAPTFEEMRAHVGLASKSGVHQLLLALEERGHIERLKARTRAVRVIEAQDISPSSALRAVLSRRDLSAECRAELLALAGREA